MLNIFNRVQWRFDLLIPAQLRQFGAFVNPPMATLTRGSSKVEKKPWQSTRGSRDLAVFHERYVELKYLRATQPTG
jgi:hypothetical protein